MAGRRDRTWQQVPVASDAFKASSCSLAAPEANLALTACQVPSPRAA